MGDITFDVETLKYYQDHYTGHDSKHQGIHNDLIALWGLRLLVHQDAFKEMRGFPDNIYDEELILETVGLWDDLEKHYTIQELRVNITSQINTYKKYPVQIDPDIFSIFLELKEDLNFTDNEIKLFIFLDELEVNEGLRDICKCHGKLNLDETYKVLSYTLQITEKFLRAILAPVGDVENFGFVSFNQEKTTPFIERCKLIDLEHFLVRRYILQKQDHSN